MGQCLGHFNIASHLPPQLLLPLPQRGGTGVIPIIYILSEGHDFRKEEKSDVGLISGYRLRFHPENCLQVLWLNLYDCENSSLHKHATLND